MKLDDIARMLRPLSVRVANLISRVVIKRVDDAKKVQELQVEALADEVVDEVERFQNYGFTSKPLEGAEAVLLSVGGRREHSYCLGVEDRRYRIVNLSDGEVAVYNDTGAKIVMKANGDIEITPKSGQTFRVSASFAEVAGASNPVAKGDSLNSAITTLATSIGSAVGGIPTGGTAAAALITTAIGVFNASAASALSTKVKIS